MRSIALVLFGVFSASAAHAEIQADDCKKQYLAADTTTIACEVAYKPSQKSIDAVLNAASDGPELEDLKAMLTTTACTATVEADKAEVEASWFTKELVAIPEAPVACTMTDNAGQTLNVNTMAKIDCTRPGGAWACQTSIRETTGLSFLGAVLEDMVNGNPDLSKNLEKLVGELSTELGIDS